MQPELFNRLFIQWKEQQLKFQKNRKGKYLHFDRFICFHRNIQWFKAYLKNALKNVPKHGFYPFIKTKIVTPRTKYEKDPVTNKKKLVLTEKERPIAYASHFDSFIYSWYAHILTHFYYEKLSGWGIDDCVLAYLKKDGKCNIHFASEVFEDIRKREQCVVLTFDLKSFFDNIDHNQLERQWCRVLEVEKLPKDHLAIFKTLTSYTYIDREYLDYRFPRPIDKGERKDRICTPEQFREMVKNDRITNETAGNRKVVQKNPNCNKIAGSKRFGEMCGIPQGSPISACLSNIYLIEFDRLINAFARRKKALYRRYSDDLIIVCPPEHADFFHRLITKYISKSEVVVNESKTEMTVFKRENEELNSFSIEDKPRHLQYLGFEFNGRDVFIRSSSMSRYHRRLKSSVNKAVEDAYDSEFSIGDKIFRKKLYNRFTHIGRRNFVRYALNAKKIMNESVTIKNQVKGSIEKIERLIESQKKDKELLLNQWFKPFKRMK